jgi:hypothetical protein
MTGEDSGEASIRKHPLLRIPHRSSSTERGKAALKVGDPAQDSLKTQYRAFGTSYTDPRTRIAALTRSRMTKESMQNANSSAHLASGTGMSDNALYTDDVTS